MATNNEVEERPAGGNARQGSWRSRANQFSGESNFDGATKEIGGVLCLPAETHIKARVGYNKFRDLLRTYIAKHFRDAVEIANAVQTLVDPVQAFNDKHRPEEPIKKPESGSIDEMIMREVVKDYVIRLKGVQANVTKMYAIIWGQCSEGLQSAIRMDSAFDEKANKFDGIWLLKTIEKNLAGLKDKKI